MMTLATQNKAVSSLSKNNSASSIDLTNKLQQQKHSASQIRFLESGDSGRKHLETFISKVFKNYYNADLDHFYPNLLSIESAIEPPLETTEPDAFHSDDSIKAVAGIRCAADEALFSEYYLENSLENELASVYDKRISRDMVVEVGNLAPANVGQMRWLITVMTGFLYSAGFRYIVFTAIPGVSTAFKRMKLPLTPVIEAKQDCLPDSIKCKWGPEYYQLKPMVLFGDITEIHERVQADIYSKKIEFIPLFEQACQLGEQFRNRQNCLSGDAA